MRVPASLIPLGTLLAVASCGTDVRRSLPTSAPTASLEVTDQSVCRGRGFRQMDFWLGTWTIADAGTGAAAGVSEVRSLLGGCAVEERFTAANGARGRSLNVFDRERGTWQQVFRGVFAQSFILEGQPTRGAAMVMTGRRATFQGANASRITWTLTGRQVRQRIENSFDGGVTWLPGFDGIYTPATSITPAPPLLPGICPAVGVFRQFDFALGEWDVMGPRGRSLGRSTITTDLDQCLVIEEFSGPDGRAISYFHFDLGLGKWLRTTVDGEGRHLALSGGIASPGAMQWSGSYPVGGGQPVANVWTSTGRDTMTQQWTGYPRASDSYDLTYRRVGA